MIAFIFFSEDGGADWIGLRPKGRANRMKPDAIAVPVADSLFPTSTHCLRHPLRYIICKRVSQERDARRDTAAPP